MSFQARNADRAKNHYASTPQWQIDDDTERGPCLARESHYAVGGRGFKTINVLIAFCEVNNLQVDYANEYGEPGYTPAQRGVLLSNWNRISKNLQKRLEAQGYELEWSDEWTIDYEARDAEDKPTTKAYRTSADSHGWESRVRLCESDYLFPDNDPQEWIDDALNDDNRPLPSWFEDSELEQRGFAVMAGNDKEVGFHPGQNETPDKAGIPALRDQGYDTLLQITDRGQFDTRYRVWTRREAEATEPGAQYCEHADNYYVHA